MDNNLNEMPTNNGVLPPPPPPPPMASQPLPPPPPPPLNEQAAAEEVVEQENEILEEEQEEEQVLDEQTTQEASDQEISKQKNKKEKKQKQEKESKPKKEKQPKEKKQKESKIKRVKEKKKLTKKKKILILILAIVFVVLAIAGGITAYIIIDNKNNIKLSTPSIIDIVQWDNGTILVASEVENAKFYEFIIYDLTTNSPTEKPPFRSSSNTLVLSTVLNTPGKYSFKVRAGGVGPRSISDLSEESQPFEVKQGLQSPNFDIKNIENGTMEEVEVDGQTIYRTNSNLEDDVIIWSKVENAVGYIINLRVNEGKIVTDKQYKYKVNDNTIEYSLSEIYKEYGTGAYQISVIAVPTLNNNNTFYLNSGYNQKIFIEYFDQQTKIKEENIEFNKETNVLKFSLPIGSKVGNRFELVVNYIDSSKQTIILERGNNKTNFEYELKKLDTKNVISFSITNCSDGSQYSKDSEPAIYRLINE